MAITVEAVERCRNLDPATGNHRPLLAETLTVYSIAAGDFDLKQDAVAAAKEAVEIRRELAASQPQAFTAALAGSLVTLSHRRRALNEHQEAMDAVKEATSIYRQLAQRSPKAFNLPLAQSLTVFGNRLLDINDPRAAKVAFDEAIQVWGLLAQERPGLYQTDLKMTLESRQKLGD